MKIRIQKKDSILNKIIAADGFLVNKDLYSIKYECKNDNISHHYYKMYKQIKYR